jgi:hypothetical protein
MSTRDLAAQVAAAQKELAAALAAKSAAEDALSKHRDECVGICTQPLPKCPLKISWFNRL